MNNGENIKHHVFEAITLSMVKSFTLKNALFNTQFLQQAN
jgi:hypothetical protein